MNDLRRQVTWSGAEKKARFAEIPQFLPTLSQHKQHKQHCLIEALKMTTSTDKDPHHASEIEAQRDTRLVERPEFVPTLPA